MRKAAMNSAHRGQRGMLALTLLALAALGPGAAMGQEDAGGGPPQTGTDPRDFAPKFMPYARYTELKNGLEQNEIVMFGLVAFSPKFAMTYEIPLGYERDVGGTDLFDPMTGECAGFLPGGGAILPNGLRAEGDCQETGIGDMNLRFMARANTKFLGGDLLYGAQLDFPTSNNDVLGSETMVLAPMAANIWDLKFWPGPGAFAALMHFYKFDIFKDDGRPDVDMYVGRYFMMLPLNEKHKIYALPEFQPVYDFENSHFSFWFGPEFGKMLAPGRIVYLKPGWGIDPDGPAGDREFSFELGFRFFL